MSDGTSTCCRRITKSQFPACPTRRCRSQAPFCLCTLRMVPVHPEGTFERLRYPFGGDRPSQTPRQAVSRGRFHGRRLEAQRCRGGIPTAPRQRPNHYAFRAGRNLPDKEFRYLRTVIVTAAVYWGLSSRLRSPLTAPVNLPAPGRRQPIYLTFRFRIGLCFC